MAIPTLTWFQVAAALAASKAKRTVWRSTGWRSGWTIDDGELFLVPNVDTGPPGAIEKFSTDRGLIEFRWIGKSHATDQHDDNQQDVGAQAARG